MTDKLIVSYDPTNKRLELPQTVADRYVGEQPMLLLSTLQVLGLFNGRNTYDDGTKLDFVTVTGAVDLDEHNTKLGFISVTGPVDLDALNTSIGGLSNVVTLMGLWDASTGLFPTSTLAGESWIVSADGSVAGIDFTADDRIVALVDAASNNLYADWHKLDYTDAVLSVNGKTGPVILEEADISDLKTYLLPVDLDSLAKLNALVGESIIIEGDPRLTDARTPTAHTHTPEAHTHPISELDDLDDYRVPVYAVVNLPAGLGGQTARVSDGDALLAWGDVVVNTGGGTTPYLVWYSGINWTVIGK